MAKSAMCDISAAKAYGKGIPLMGIPILARFQLGSGDYVRGFNSWAVRISNCASVLMRTGSVLGGSNLELRMGF